MNIRSKKLLRGGSLASTSIIETDVGSYVRKEVNIKSNREYGYQRWYSQLKRLQRYNVLFPNLFAEVVRYGINDDSALFDLRYYENAVNCFEYFSKCKNRMHFYKVRTLVTQITDGMEKMHSVKIKSCTDSLDLYFEEEIKRKIEDCLHDNEFYNFYKKDDIVFNGKKIKSFKYLIDEYEEFGKAHYTLPMESYTHGNITLENIIYDEDKDTIVFIDPYEENIIDNCYNEYSQLLQSCNSHYEIYNSLNIESFENIDLDVPYGIEKFNQLFHSYMESSMTESQIKVVKYFEISQFIRMLPFKLNVDRKKMFLFYSLASHLTNKLLGKY